jgi:hypothetical protein
MLEDVLIAKISLKVQPREVHFAVYREGKPLLNFKGLDNGGSELPRSHTFEGSL